LKKAQLGKLEVLLGYKLKLAGLPAPRDVVAGGTSQTCPACAARDKKNRPSQESFCCIACGFSAHADSVGAVNIARRGVAMIGITKGDKLAPREQDMVARLRLRDDGGLGPLAANAAGGFVADRASTAKGVSFPQGELPGLEQKTTHGDQNARKGVFAARGATLFRGQNGKKPLRGKGVTHDPPA
jgi:putative transposase